MALTLRELIEYIISDMRGRTYEELLDEPLPATILEELNICPIMLKESVRTEEEQ